MSTKQLEWAVITGASSGIGRAFTELFARDGVAVILVAQDMAELKAIAQKLETQYGIRTEVLATDLSVPAHAQRLHDFCVSQNMSVSYVVNSAGFGEYGKFEETPWTKEYAMMQLNNASLTLLCKLFGADMVQARKGHIVNLASVAAFSPGPKMAVYYATKAYVLSLSEALSEEWKQANVHVMALCPGPTNSGFATTSGAGKTGLFNPKSVPSAAQVADYGYKHMKRGKTVVLYPWRIRVGVMAVRFLPRSVVRRLAGRVLR